MIVGDFSDDQAFFWTPGTGFRFPVEERTGSREPVALGGWHRTASERMMGVGEKKTEILIADRNPRVREFLRREMERAGHQVRVAENSRQIIRQVYQEEGPVLLILDPDLPDADSTALLRKLRDRIPRLPVIIHSLFPNCDATASFAFAFVEKQGNSVEHLKLAVSDILNTRQEISHGKE